MANNNIEYTLNQYAPHVGADIAVKASTSWYIPLEGDFYNIFNIVNKYQREGFGVCHFVNNSTALIIQDNGILKYYSPFGSHEILSTLEQPLTSTYIEPWGKYSTIDNLKISTAKSQLHYCTSGHWPQIGYMTMTINGPLSSETAPYVYHVYRTNAFLYIKDVNDTTWTTIPASSFKDRVVPSKLFCLLVGPGGGGASGVWDIIGGDKGGGGGGSGAYWFGVLSLEYATLSQPIKIILPCGGSKASSNGSDGHHGGWYPGMSTSIGTNTTIEIYNEDNPFHPNQITCGYGGAGYSNGTGGNAGVFSRSFANTTDIPFGITFVTALDTQISIPKIQAWQIAAGNGISGGSRSTQTTDDAPFGPHRLRQLLYNNIHNYFSYRVHKCGDMSSGGLKRGGAGAPSVLGNGGGRYAQPMAEGSPATSAAPGWGGGGNGSEGFSTGTAQDGRCAMCYLWY